MKLPLLLFAASILAAQTGEIVLTGAIITGGGSAATGYEAAKAFDGNFLTSFSSTTTGTWVGVDAGKAVTLTRAMIAPRAGDATITYAFWGVGANDSIQGSNSATFASGNATLYTVPAWATGLPNITPGVLTEVAAAGGPYRYFRWNDTTNYGMLAEIRFYITATSGVSAMPAPPTITPGSGPIMTGSTTVTMVSRTTSAVIHYTTNGTAPTCSSAAYSGSFTLAVLSTVNIQAIACDASTSTTASEVSGQYYQSHVWNAGDYEYDDNGQLVEAHAGHLLFAEGKWWRLGLNAGFGGKDTLLFLGNPGWWLYSSTDLKAWHNEGQVIPATNGAHSERATMVFNASTSKYVIWGNCAPWNASSPPGYGTMAACILTADHPQGPWTSISSSYNPGGLGYKDNMIFVDDDGTAYTVFVNGAQSAMAIMQLSADYLSAIGSPVYLSTGLSGVAVREAPAMFKRNGVYFCITSASDYLVPTTGAVNIQYQTATTPLGTWSAPSGAGSFYTQSPANGNPYNGQSTQVIKIPGTQDGWLFIADNWVGNSVTSPAGSTWIDFAHSTMVYVPLTFPTNTTVRALTGTDAPTNWDTSYWTKMFPLPNGAKGRFPK